MPDNQSESFDSLDRAVPSTGHDLLRDDGLQLVPPEDLHPNQVRGCLWEIIYALASRRIYLHSTDHLSDGALYRWLYGEWLPRSLEIQPENRGQPRIIEPIDSDADAGNEIWLRYYADAEVRRTWANTFPEDTVPFHEPAPFDRDRWLPRPVGHTARADIVVEPDDPPIADPVAETTTSFEDLRDPLKLEDVENEIRAERPVFELSDATPDPSSLSEDSAGADPVRGDGLESWQCPHTELARAGVCLPPPEEMTDEMLPSKLWELLHELACRGFYLLHTDHLSDRELYSRLWREDLREPAILPGQSDVGGWFHDFTGTGNSEDYRMWLACYASDEERAAYARAHPEEPLPSRIDRAFRRDHRVPKGPF